MKLIFKIYKKVRELKAEERKVKKNIEQLKLDSNKYFKKEEVKLRRSILNLEKQLKEKWKDYNSLSTCKYIEESRIRDRIIEKMRKEMREQASSEFSKIYYEKEKLKKREAALDERELELDERDLGIVQGVNK